MSKGTIIYYGGFTLPDKSASANRVVSNGKIFASLGYETVFVGAAPSDEEWAKLYTMHYGLDTYGMRYFNVFGRRQTPDGAYAAVIPKFIKMLINDEQPTINGDGKQSRDFTYIENVIEANLKACLASHEAAGEAYNIAYGGREYLIDIYYALTKALGVDIEPNFGPDRAGDIKHSNADISKAKNLLGYDPDYDFAKGLAEAISWYKENL